MTKRLNKVVNIGLSIIIGFLSLSEIKANVAGDSVTTLAPAPKHLKETYLVNNLLKQNHYLKVELNDSLSKAIFNRYLKALDYNKTYFTQADIDYFSKYKLELDDLISQGNVDVAFQIFTIYRDRANARIDHVFKIIEKGFDFTIDENLDLDDKSLTWSKDVTEINERWRKIIKSQALSLKLAGKEDEDIKISLTKRYQQYRKSINQFNSDDVFQFFLNSYTESFDPHTNYFSPVSSDNFNINMSLSLEGIGARLRQSMDYTIIDEVIAGGPAFKSKFLQKDDKIVGVGQGKNEAFVDVVGWRLSDVVQLIRGPKGTTVRLQVLKAEDGVGAIPKELTLIRDKIKLEEQSAKSEIISIKEGNKNFKLGVITLPNFYVDFDEARAGVKDYKSTTRDVSKIIDQLKAEKVDGILVDLRYNGGGSLQEAIDMTGLFIDKGPVVQVKNYTGEIEVKNDMDSRIQYDGPLAVLINRFSASASEIFSGAIQDYKRGVIIGESSFGKGTVQNLIALNRMFPGDDEKMGNLKLTLAKFYRVTGSSTQNIGVTPDISFPSTFEAGEFGESAEPNAMPWDEIQSAYYRPSNKISDRLITNLNKMYLNDLQTDISLKFLQEDIARIKAEKDDQLSLNLEKRKVEQDTDVKQREDRKRLLGIPAEKISVESIGEEDADTKKDINEDPYLKEGLKLLANLVKDTVG